MLTPTEEEKRHERLREVLSSDSYENISNLSGVSVRTLVRINKNKTDPKFSHLIRICAATGFDIKWVAFGDLEHQKTSEEEFCKYDDQVYLLKNICRLNEAQTSAITLILKSFLK